MINRLDIIGPYPPPIGGISVHIARIESLLKEYSIPYRIYNHGYHFGDNIVATNKSFLWYIKYLFMEKGRIVHFHNFFKLQFLYYYLFSLISPNRLIITIHSEHLLNSNKVFLSFILFFLKRTRYLKLLSVSEKFSNHLNHLQIESAFLPAYVPPLNVNPQKLISVGNKSFFMFSMWKIDKNTAQEIYNIDLAFNLLTKIKDDFQMLFLIGTKDGSDLNYLNARINKFDLQNHITIIFNEQLTDYINNCKFLLRCNNEDGYGVSLQESIDLGVPAIATNVCTRPKGTIIFKKNDLEGLLQKVNFVLNSNSESILLSSEKPTYHFDLLNMYKAYLTPDENN